MEEFLMLLSSSVCLILAGYFVHDGDVPGLVIGFGLIIMATVGSVLRDEMIVDSVVCDDSLTEDDE